MANRLQSINLLAPGFYGLNTNQKSIEEPGWAQAAENCVIDGSGRLAARKGWNALTSSPISGTPDIEAIYEYINAAGTSKIISAANAKLYYGTTTLTDITGSLTPADDNWKFQNFNGKVVGFQDGETPIVYSGSGNFADISFTYPSAGTNTFSGVCLSAFGRVWSTDSTKTVLKYSDLLIETSWTDDSGGNGDGTGSAGIIDLKSVWVYGMDEVVALEEFNGFLLIFGKKNVLIYNNPYDVSNMAIQDTVEGTGCIARDSVQNIGTDVLFLSDSGVRSFRKTIQEKSMPLNDISKNVRSDLLSLVSAENKDLIRSVYHEVDGFYILNLPTSGISYVFDIRHVLQDGSFRATTWNNINPKAMVSARDGNLYMGQAGVVATYSTYQDNGTNFTMTYYSPWMTMGTDRLKIPKKMSAIVSGGNNYTLDMKIAYNYSSSTRTSSVTISTIANPAEWGVAEWGLGEWSGGSLDGEVKAALFGSGNTVQLGLVTAVSGNAISFQRIELYAKAGRTD